MTCGVLLSATADFVALFVQAGSALPCSAPVTTIVDSSANAGVQCERDGACQRAKRKTRGSHNVVLLLDAIRNDNYYHLH